MKNVLVTILLLGATLALLTDKGMSAQGNSSNASNLSTTNSSNTQKTEDDPAPNGQRKKDQADSDNALEEKKLALEYQKLEVERSKAIWSAVATIVPLLAALGTLIYSVWSFRKQSTETARLQNESAKLQFEIKAAEIAFSGKTPEAVTNRAKVLKTIFGARLPENFPPPFDPKQHGGGKESPEEKLFFLELLLKYPDKETEIIKGWEVLFLGDTWLDRVKLVLLKEDDTVTGSLKDGEKASLEKPNAATTTPSLPESAARESADNKLLETSTQPPHPPEAAKPSAQQQPETLNSTDHIDPKK